MTVNTNLRLTSPPNDFSPKEIIDALPNFASAFSVTYKDYSQVDISKGETAILQAYDTDVFNARNNLPLEPYRYGSYFVYQANKASN